MKRPATPLQIATIARAAGARILEVYKSGSLETSLKADASPVTAADLAAHETIAEALGRLAPSVPLISEEADLSQAVSILQESPWCWLVDPLDGTRDFIARSEDFTVNIALMHKARPVLGCIYAPARDLLYYAAEGEGAYLEARGGAPTAIHCRSMHPTRFTVLVSSKHGAGEAERLRALYPECELRRVGAALKYGLIAAGEADLAVRFTPTSLWDTAAAQCILETAGGAILEATGKPLQYTHGSLENPPFVATGQKSLDVPALVSALTTS